MSSTSATTTAIQIPHDPDDFGATVGAKVGAKVGTSVGAKVGTSVGTSVGAGAKVQLGSCGAAISQKPDARIPRMFLQISSRGPTTAVSPQ